ncbi:MAG: hypothetical protein IJX05_01285, partial [Clostridia bacterium]|nr:hypothetical protein [Clostridia bacterium]
MQTVSAATAPSTLVETKVVSRVEYGSEFDVKAGATVMSPAGIEVEPVNGKVKAEQVGVYKVTYKAQGAGEYASYTYNVEVYMDNEYKFIVDGNGSAIPTFCGVDTKVTLPAATLYIYDEEDERWVADTDAVVKVRVSAPDGEVSNKEAGDEITLDAEGKYFFTYVVTVPGGENIYTTEYSTQVQRTFKDDTAPTLSISGVPESSSINTAIKLPNATATDNYDERVGLTITVKKDGVDVKDAKVDKKTGFATGEFWGDAKAKFDNDTFMTFYPTEAGSYEVTYQATDCAGNSTAVYKYTITVSDTTAPVFDEFDVSSIPSNWGKLVYKYDETATDKKEQV